MERVLLGSPWHQISAFQAMPFEYGGLLVAMHLPCRRDAHLGCRVRRRVVEPFSMSLLCLKVIDEYEEVLL